MSKRFITGVEHLETLRTANLSSRCRNRNVALLLQRKDLYWRALRIVSRKKNGAGEKARDAIKDRVDHAIVDEVAAAMREQRYRFSPIPPPGGVNAPPPPSLADFLVYEVLAMVLCAVYDLPYKPKHSKDADIVARHEVMSALQQNFMGSSWAVVNKIDPSFLSTNRMVLMYMISKRIHDKRFLAVLWAALQAGCVHELATSRSMTMDCLLRTAPSERDHDHTLKPILSQIYLSHLDEFVYEVLESFDDAQREQSRQQMSA